MLGLTRTEWRCLLRRSAVICLVMIGAVALFGLIDKSSIMMLPPAVAAILCLIVFGIMCIMGRDSLHRVSVLVVPLFAFLGTAIGVFIISLY